MQKFRVTWSICFLLSLTGGEKFRGYAENSVFLQNFPEGSAVGADFLWLKSTFMKWNFTEISEFLIFWKICERSSSEKAIFVAEKQFLWNKILLKFQILFNLKNSRRG